MNSIGIDNDNNNNDNSLYKFKPLQSSSTREEIIKRFDLLLACEDGWNDDNPYSVKPDTDNIILAKEIVLKLHEEYPININHIGICDNGEVDFSWVSKDKHISCEISEDGLDIFYIICGFTGSIDNIIPLDRKDEYIDVIRKYLSNGERMIFPLKRKSFEV